MNATSPVNSIAPWRRYFSIYTALWKNSVVRELGFKTNFLMWVVVELLWFALQLAFIAVIYQHTEHIGTWSKWQVVMLMGASQVIQQVFTAVFLNNCTQLSDYVRGGRLDFMLLLPVNTRFLVSLRQVDLGSFVNALSGVAVMAYAARQLHLTPAIPQVIGFALLCGVGILIHYALMFLLASTCFWTVRSQGVVWGYYSLFNVARLPDGAFQRGAFKAFFTFVLPMLLVSNVPAKVLVNKLSSPLEILLLLGMSLVCLLISEWGWRVSLRRYTSASS